MIYLMAYSLLFYIVGKLLEPGVVHFKKRKTRFCDVWAGQYVTFAKSKTGEVYAWGLNNYYQLGKLDLLLLVIFIIQS